MIIDEILDYKDNATNKIDIQYIYDEAKIFNFDYIINAIDNGNNKDIQNAICEYIKNNNYNLDICDFVKTIKFVDKKANKKTYYFVEDDCYGQHGWNIEEMTLTKYQYKNYEDDRKIDGRHGFLTDNYASAIYYVND